MKLHEFGAERVALVRLAPDTRLESHTHDGGEEVFVIEGRYFDEDGDYPAGSWVRTPPGSAHAPYTDASGALVYVKVGHLA